MTPTIAVVYGTRPEAIKCAPVVRALEAFSGFDVLPVLTGQHPTSVIRPITDLFGFREAENLEVLVQGQGLNQLAARTLARLDAFLDAHHPDAVLAQGDTTAVAMSAVAAYNLRIPFLHLEAGLRTDTLGEPHPEEGNRRLAGQLASLHLAPTRTARKNLQREGISPEAIAVTGNTVIDALHFSLERQLSEADRLPESIEALLASGSRIVLVTTHRRENWKDLASIGQALKAIAEAFPDCAIVYPAHANPRIRAHLAPFIAHLANVAITGPLGYHAFSHLLRASHLVLTDSGGIQEEAPSLGIPVLVMRNRTERPEAVAAGTVRMVGPHTDAIVENAAELLSDRDAYAAMAHAVNPYGDGAAAERVVAAISHYFGRGSRLPDFEG